MATPATVSTPFSCSPDPTVLLLTPALKAVEYKTRYAIEHRQGLAAILGDAGLGKSTMLRHLYGKYSALPSYRALMLPTPLYSSDHALLKAIATGFGCPGKRSKREQHAEFEGWLLDQFSQGLSPVLFLDEAQKLPPDQLELMRTLLNFETDREKLLQIVVAGNLELRDRLKQQRHKPLRTRVFAPSLISAMTHDEMAEMLRLRCEREGIPCPFTAGALRVVYEFSAGVPRIVLQAAEFSYAQMREFELPTVDHELMDTVCAGLTLDDESE